MKHLVGMWTILYIELFTKLYKLFSQEYQWMLGNSF